MCSLFRLGEFQQGTIDIEVSLHRHQDRPDLPKLLEKVN